MASVKKISTARIAAHEAFAAQRPHVQSEGPYDSACRIIDNRLRAIRHWYFAGGRTMDSFEIASLIDDLKAYTAKLQRHPQAQLKSALQTWFKDLPDMFDCIDVGNPDTIRSIYAHLGHEYHPYPDDHAKPRSKRTLN